MKVAYLDCFSGISGDMFLGALVDAGVPFTVLEASVTALGLDARLVLRRVNRSGIDAAKVDVVTADGTPVEMAHATSSTGAHAHQHSASHSHSHGDEGPDHVHSHEPSHKHSHFENEPINTHAHNSDQEADQTHSHVHGRSLSAIQKLIRDSSLSAEVQQIALKAFQLLGDAEAKIHNVPVEHIHFHEVGAVDAIADIVASSAGCDWLQVDRWLCSPLNVGGGHVHCAHGKFPVPAPATLELLRGLQVYSSGIQKELVTPTGAALLRALKVTSSGFPVITMDATGYGAGSRDIAGQPNVLRLVIGQSDESSEIADRKATARVGIIETTIDDATPELLSYVADRLMAAGASDVYRTPIQMKKGRTGIHLTVLCSPAKAEALQKLVFTETTTLGLRYREESKRSLDRKMVPVMTEWGQVRIKVGILDDDQIVNFAPEYEDCRALAEKYQIPLKTIMQAAITAYLADGTE